MSLQLTKPFEELVDQVAGVGVGPTSLATVGQRTFLGGR